MNCEKVCANYGSPGRYLGIIIDLLEHQLRHGLGPLVILVGLCVVDEKLFELATKDSTARKILLEAFKRKE